MRVTPAVKYASEEILHRIGLSMTQAMELFLRRVIVDERLPFDVVALDEVTIARLSSQSPDTDRTKSKRTKGSRKNRHVPGKGG